MSELRRKAFQAWWDGLRDGTIHKKTDAMEFMCRAAFMEGYRFFEENLQAGEILDLLERHAATLTPEEAEKRLGRFGQVLRENALKERNRG